MSRSTLTVVESQKVIGHDSTCLAGARMMGRHTFTMAKRRPPFNVSSRNKSLSRVCADFSV
eukprot:CAMPEP_0202697922 /NCGR_PEP_ID=MMETSP1385-20130828/11222_1 /ASSEMBLY_ACC=CAM_ASM_000861 /TAXON_ID=933848 /ORGANISM="Elphidium margaritaceum" /LENGTH=60 /DNA_ID=CAMNT_0049354501 /DNA_START=189 /DNA_END=371 /DNA_ORIENTATION=-